MDRKSEEAEFLRIKAWNSQAEAAADNLAKDRRIGVEVPYGRMFVAPA